MDEETKKKVVETVQGEARLLNKQNWFHGLMPRDEIEDLLKKDGDFLARKTDVGAKEQLVISVHWSNRVRHVLVKVGGDLHFFVNDAISFPSVDVLVCFFVGSKTELFPDGTKLLRPILRPEWYLLHDNIQVKKKIGSGCFGDVFIGELIENGKKVDVAIKMLKGKLGKKERSGFVKEASLNRRFNHPNIVRLLGIAAQVDPIMVVLELAPGGSLRGHLKDHPELPVEKMTKFVFDAAKGLQYLSELGVIHRDIAARNCLLGAELTVKISDFGLSIANNEVKEAKLSKVPIRWLAPETLKQGLFTTKTDVYSYGVMMWEVYVRCKSDPYPGMTNAEARFAIQSGKTVEQPPDAPQISLDIMKDCFNHKPEDRPSFTMIVQRFRDAGQK